MADKKITQLPSLSFISGSTTGYYAGEVVLPIVHNNTTVKMEAQKFALYATQWSATTASNTFYGNQTVNGNVVITGNITAQEIHTEITSASIIFESGSTIFGNSEDDTHTITGTININGKVLGNAPLDYTSQSLNTQTGSQEAVNLRISSVTGSMNTQSSSQDAVNYRNSTVTSSLNFATASLNFTTGALNIASGSYNRFYQVTASVHSTTASLNQATSSLNFASGALNVATGSYNRFYDMTSSVHFTTQSLNVQTGSQNSLNAQIGIASASLNFTTGALNEFTGSVIGQTNTISIFTASINAQTGSQNSLNTSVGLITSSIYGEISSLNNVFNEVSNVTGAFAIEFGSIQKHILAQAKQTASQESINTTISTVTGSMRAEIGGIEAYTASLKNAIIVNGSNVQIIGELDVARLNVQYVSSSVSYNSGSNIFGDASNDKHEFTGSVNIADTLFIKGQAIGTGELNAFTASQISKDFTLSKVTASIDTHILKQSTQTGSQDIVNYNISVVTSSIDKHILNIATQTGSQDLVNLAISTFTGSLRSELNLIEALTASMKAAAIVSSSQQIKDYFTFAQTSSINTFYGNQFITGTLDVRDGVTGSFKGNLAGTATNANNIFVSNPSSNTNYALLFTTAGSNGYLAANTDAFGGLYYNPSTNKLTISGSAETSGSQIITGSLLVSGSTYQTGNNTLIGNTIMSGSIEVSGSSTFKNSIFTVTGSSYFTGSHHVNGNSTFSGSVYIASGSSYYRGDHKLFNFGQFASLETQSGSANTAYPMKLGYTYNNPEGFYIANDVNGFPTRITAQNAGVYNIQFSAQLANSANTNISFDIWFNYTGSLMENSNTQIDVNKSAGQVGRSVAAWNLLTHIEANDYVELMWNCNAATGQILYTGIQSTPSRPANPSVIATITQVS